MTDDLEAFRLVREADVYKSGELAATLARTPEGIRFTYLADWLDRRGRPIATTLPLTSVPLVRSGSGLPAYFAGLLPEGRRLGALRRLVKTSADDELSLLLAVGTDAVGDVTVVPAGEPLTAAQPRLVVDDFSTLRFADLLDAMQMSPDRSALPGVQDKASAAMLNPPLARRGARFILKLDPPEYPGLVRNEAFFLALLTLPWVLEVP